MGFCNSVREAWKRAIDRCFQLFPCLSDPGRRSSLVLKVALVVLHLIFVGVLFAFDSDLIDKTRKQPWYTAVYLVLLMATLFQYFFTSASSPGYVVDAMRAFNESHAIFSKTSSTSKQSASSKDGSLLPLTGSHQPGENTPGMKSASWMKLLMGMYPPGSSSRSWTCTYCHVLQPPRSKHCHDCDKCVLQFDHHCVWLGTCIGQGNHCRFWLVHMTCVFHDDALAHASIVVCPTAVFEINCTHLECYLCIKLWHLKFSFGRVVWISAHMVLCFAKLVPLCFVEISGAIISWYIFEESILCTWTCILYVTSLKGHTTREWWKNAVMILFLVILFISLIFLLLLLLFHSYLVLTNQTTYELARRRRIIYLRGIPGRVYPFSKGICRNIYNFCCPRSSIYTIEPLPVAEELQARARPYTCMEILSCRCC